MKLSEMLQPFPDDWQAQRRHFGLTVERGCPFVR